MPVKIVHPNHIEIVGFGHVLLASPPLSPAAAELDTGQITEEAALTSRAFAVVGKPIRGAAETLESQPHYADLRKGIEGFLTEDGIRYILEIEGKPEPGVEIDLAKEKTCSDSTLTLVTSRLEKHFMVRSIELPPTHSSNFSAAFSRKDTNGKFLVETVRLAFGSEELRFSREKVISVISEIADLLNGRVGPASTD